MKNYNRKRKKNYYLPHGNKPRTVFSVLGQNKHALQEDKTSILHVETKQELSSFEQNKHSLS